MGERVCGCRGWRRSGETRRASVHVGEALLGSSAALALWSPQVLVGQSAWLGGQERHSLTGKLLRTPGITGNAQPCCFPLQNSGPGRLVDLSWTHTEATELCHPCLSNMPTDQVPEGRLLLICPVLSFPDKSQL